MSSLRRPVYTNPSAKSWTSPPQSDLSRILKFHQSLPGFTPTPLVPLPDAATELGVKSVYVKDESNRLGLPSFKILGASWATFRAIAKRAELPLETGLADVGAVAQKMGLRLFTATEGNHGRAIAKMARILGIEAEIFVSENMNVATEKLIQNQGAKVVRVRGTYDDAVLKADEEGKKVGAVVVQDTAWEGYEETPGVRCQAPVLNGPDEMQWIVDGYSTLLREIDEQLGEESPSLIITPVGVGSLAQAVVLHSKLPGRSTSVLTVEPDTAGCLRHNLQAGQITTIPTRNTIMAGMNCGTLSSIAWPIHKAGVDASVTVSDFEAHQAIEYLHNAGVTAGPCGGAALAALRHVAREDPEGIGLHAGSVVVLLCTEGAREYKTPKDVSSNDPVALTQALVQIDSSNPGLGKSPGLGETEIANYIAAWLEHRDIEVHWVEEVPGRPSIVGVVRGSGGGKSLMFNGHTDTVTNAGYEVDPLSSIIENGAVQGRGSFDMKAGIAASMIAMARAKTAKLRGDVILTAVADGENLSMGTEQVLKAGWRADGAVVSEPSVLDVTLAHKGFVWLEVDILGTAAHGSRPELGVDAITRAGHFLVELDNYSQDLLSRKSNPSVQSTGSAHSSLITGGEEPSSYPAKCTITIERRTVPGENALTVEQEIRCILERIASKTPDFRYEVRVTFLRFPFQVSQDDPFVQIVLQNVEKVVGSKPVIRPESAWTDCSLLAVKGIPAVLFGVDGGGAHAMREWATVESIEKVTRALESIAKEFCA